MKYQHGVLLICLLAVFLTACGAKQTKNMPKSAGYLPGCLEKVREGGEVPEDKGSKADISEGKYPMESIWGTWVPVSEFASGETFTAETIAYTNEETGQKDESTNIELKVFPKKISFCPAWVEADGNSMGMSVIYNRKMTIDTNDMNQEEADYEDTAIGGALRNQGLGQGFVEYDYIEPKDSLEAISLSLDGGKYRIAYGMSDDILAIGLINTNDSEPSDFDIEEIDYRISFSGWKLTLTYDEESVTYIPEGFNQSDMIDLYQNGLEPGYEDVDGILGITDRGTTQQIMYDLHEGYVDADLNFSEEGTLMIEASNGKQQELQYLMSSYMLTLFSEKEIGVYSGYRSTNASGNITAGNEGLKLVDTEGSGPSIKVEGEKIGFSAMSDLQKLLNAGFTTVIDTNQAMNPCVVSDEIVLQKSGSSIKVKVVNPWDSPAALRECKICYVYVDDTSGTISTADDSEIGVTKYEVIEKYFEAAYEKTSTLLRYKSCSTIDHDISFDSSDGNHGGRLLDIDTTEMEMMYHFKNGVLCAYEIQCPELLYNGLQDNVSNEALAGMDSATMTGVMKTRDDVLGQLKAVFADEGISINIDESTGEIVMDSAVLFDIDSYTLTVAGEQYINSFMGAYASVILDDSLKDVISEVCFEGHTDSSGTYDYNLELSKKRADAVLNYCINNDAAGLGQSQKARLESIAATIGYSFSDLIYDSEGNEDAAASRRVAIKFYVKI